MAAMAALCAAAPASASAAGRAHAPSAAAQAAAIDTAVPTVRPAAIASHTDIDQIALEKGCFGCASGLRLVLRRDGSAIRTLTGQARHGTSDQRFQASIEPVAFEALARQAVASGLEGWADSYQDPQLQDGAWVQLSVSRGARVKQVFQRNGAGPAGLTALVQAIDTWQAQAPFEVLR